jgi:hypothetical protein
MKTTLTKISAALLLLMTGSNTMVSAQQQAPCASCTSFTKYYTPFAPDSFKLINRAFISVYIGTGEGSANFNGLHQFDVYQKLPFNTATQYSCAISGGKPEGFYFSWFARGSFASSNSNGDKITSTSGYMGINVGRTVYSNPYRKFLSSISPEMGIAYGGVSINNGTDRQGQTLANTTVLNTDLSFDLLSWYARMWHCDSPYGKAISTGYYALTMKMGYALQLGSSWACPHVSPNANINMSGFYVSMGFTISMRNNWLAIHK